MIDTLLEIEDYKERTLFLKNFVEEKYSMEELKNLLFKPEISPELVSNIGHSAIWRFSSDILGIPTVIRFLNAPKTPDHSKTYVGGYFKDASGQFNNGTRNMPSFCLPISLNGSDIYGSKGEMFYLLSEDMTEGGKYKFIAKSASTILERVLKDSNDEFGEEFHIDFGYFTTGNIMYRSKDFDWIEDYTVRLDKN